MRDPLKESTSCFLVRLRPLVLVPIGLFHRTRRPLLYDFIELKVLALSFIGLNVLCSLHFKAYQSLLSFKDFNVFCLYISKTSMSFVKTIKVFFTFQRLHQDYQSLLYISKTSSRLSKSSLHFKTIRVFCQDYQSLFYISKTIRVFCQDYQSLLYTSKTIRIFCQDYQSLL